jgi:hypothetical protein
MPETELLLQPRRLHEENDFAIGAFPRPKHLSRRRGYPHEHPVTTAVTTLCPASSPHTLVLTGAEQSIGANFEH